MRAKNYTAKIGFGQTSIVQNENGSIWLKAYKRNLTEFKQSYQSSSVCFESSQLRIECQLDDTIDDVLFKAFNFTFFLPRTASPSSLKYNFDTASNFPDG